MAIYVPNDEETRCYQPSKNIKIHCGIEGSVMKKKCREDAVSKEERKKHSGNFAMLAKISLGLRKFRNHIENFAMLAKLGNFARLAKFHLLAKFTVPSEINQFRYPHINFARIAKFR